VRCAVDDKERDAEQKLLEAAHATFMSALDKRNNIRYDLTRYITEKMGVKDWLAAREHAVEILKMVDPEKK
jgi:hypothetical protein